MPITQRRAPLERGGRRIQLCVSVSSETLRELKRIERGNRSAAIERLVREHVARRLESEPAT
jgi:hypothetical protein